LDKLREKLGEKEIVISRPTTMAEIMITGLDESVTKEEVVDIIVEHGECLVEEIKAGDIKRMYNGLGMIWARCPLRAANVMAKEEKVRIGWTIAKVELLPRRPLQCFKCWEYGHTKFACKASIDRKGHCFNCGAQEHTVSGCNKESRCVICEDKGYESNHRIGSKWCNTMNQFERGKQSQITRGRIMEGEKREVTKMEKEAETMKTEEVDMEGKNE